MLNLESGLAITRGNGSVLQLSRRRIDAAVAFCLQYEFEDVVADLDGGDRIEPTDLRSIEFCRRAYKLFRLLGGSTGLARRLAPAPKQIRLTRQYELFFPVFNNIYELFTLATIPDWRGRCRKAACFINETWIQQYRPQYLVELLNQFDHVFVGLENPVEQLAKEIGRPCSYLPLAVDVLRFFALPHPASRSIDVCNLGRRSTVTHLALLRMAQERRIHYHYDTVAASGADLTQRTFRVDHPSEHRQLLSNLVRRSRYFIANRARVNEASYLLQREEISSRAYEGAAGGAVMLGEAPRTDSFRQQFDWPDAVIHLPFDSPDIEQVLAELDADPQRLERARRNNLHFSALRHDWVHRLRAIYTILDLAPTTAMLEREQRLRALAQQVLDAPAGSI